MYLVILVFEKEGCNPLMLTHSLLHVLGDNCDNSRCHRRHSHRSSTKQERNTRTLFCSLCRLLCFGNDLAHLLIEAFEKVADSESLVVNDNVLRQAIITFSRELNNRAASSTLIYIEWHWSMHLPFPASSCLPEWTKVAAVFM